MIGKALSRLRRPVIEPPLSPVAIGGGTDSSEATLSDPLRDPVEVPGYYSRFGGLWTDLTNADEIAQGKLALGVISKDEYKNVKFWIDNGYVILPKAVSSSLIARLNGELETIWRQGHPSAWVNVLEDGNGVVRPIEPGDHESVDKHVKLLDIYEFSEAARQVLFAPAIQRFLEIVFERPPMAHQSLSFYRGSKQPMHQDSIFVRISSPMELTASWIALEDIQPDSGELEYYEGSHRFPEFLFEDKYKWLPPSNPELPTFYEHLHAQARERGIEAKRFLARKGDALIWSADLAHGGSDFGDASKTRHSLVTHYCPSNVYPMYFHYQEHSQKIAWGKRSYYCFAKKFNWQAGT